MAVQDRQISNGLRGSSNVGIIAIIFFLLVCAGLLYFAASHHIVRTSAGIKIYPKRQLSFEDTYIDVTSMRFHELRYHRELVSVMASHNDLEYLPGGKSLVSLKKMGQNIHEVITRFDNEYQISSSLQEINRITREKHKQLDSG